MKRSMESNRLSARSHSLCVWPLEVKKQRFINECYFTRKAISDAQRSISNDKYNDWYTCSMANNQGI